MLEIFSQILILAYGATGIVGILAYWPTIKDLWNNRSSANIPSYFIWVGTNGISFLYALLVVKDLPFIFVSGLYLLANISVLILRLKIKNKLVK